MFINEKVDSLIRHLLTIVGSWLIARGVLNESVATDVVGGAIALLSLGWSIYVKDYAKDKISGFVRQILTAAAVFIGSLSPAMIDTIISVLGTVGMVWLGWDDKEQVRQVKPDKIPELDK